MRLGPTTWFEGRDLLSGPRGRWSAVTCGIGSADVLVKFDRTPLYELLRSDGHVKFCQSIDGYMDLAGQAAVFETVAALLCPRGWTVCRSAEGRWYVTGPNGDRDLAGLATWEPVRREGAEVVSLHSRSPRKGLKLVGNATDKVLEEREKSNASIIATLKRRGRRPK